MKILIETSARLHLGLIDMNGELGRLYGSIGVAIDRPLLKLQAEHLPDEPDGGVTTTGADAARITAYARRFLAAHPLPGTVRLEALSVIPPHVGFGSGTRLALAVGTVLSRLARLDLEPAELARLLDRGKHSGIGIATFERGGLVVDGGHALARPGHRSPPVLFHHAVPPAWRFVVAIPEAPAGLAGDAEKQAFEALPSAPGSFVEKICRLLVMQMLPALIEGDLVPFGEALTRIQQLVGDSFAAVQGGRYANTISGALVAHWLDHGAVGAGQSSWGPAVYALAGDDVEARRLADIGRTFLDARAGGTILVTRVINYGSKLALSQL